jgi:hypothetical protein
MANLMTLNQNGQGITLSSDLLDKGVTDGESLKKLIGQSAPGTYTFAHTFPTGTHAMWLYYWLARGHQPLYRHSHGGRAAAANGDEHADRQHGRFLRG